MGWLLLFLFTQAYLLAFLVLAAIATVAGGCPPDRVAWGTGPTTTLGKVGGTTFLLGWLPLGGWLAQADDRPFPMWAMVAPHLVLAWVGVAFSSEQGLWTGLSWLAGLLWLGEPHGGLLHGLSAAATHAGTAPADAFALTLVWLGGTNCVLALTQWASMHVPLASVVSLLCSVALLVRALWLDL